MNSSWKPDRCFNLIHCCKTNCHWSKMNLRYNLLMFTGRDNWVEWILVGNQKQKSTLNLEVRWLRNGLDANNKFRWRGPNNKFVESSCRKITAAKTCWRTGLKNIQLCGIPETKFQVQKAMQIPFLKVRWLEHSSSGITLPVQWQIHFRWCTSSY